ncbi:MAG: hypothetical protein EA377_10230 [Phycisphaerales bacterium]|nr:MAG: hypothetical protein EA377_10230 [Phycisphaerales bacterium]
MSQFNQPTRKSGGELNVYTALLCVAVLVMLAGVVLLALRNIDYSGTERTSGGIFTLVDQQR